MSEYRHEYKYVISYFDYLSLRDCIKSVMPLDKNVGIAGEYKIRSLYFDNLYDKALMEKINGVNNREKFRIRFYNDNQNNIKLEKKSKVNGLCKEVSSPLSMEDCNKILKNDILWMKDSDYSLIRELYLKMCIQLLRPKVIVDYIREPFVDKKGNVRITFDKEIKTGLYSTDFLSDVSMVSIPENPILVEVKYDEYLPGYIQNILNLRNNQAIAFSKYGMSRMYW